MTASFLTPNRTVLLIGDEALYVYKVAYNAAKLVDSIPWQTDDFEEVVVGLIRKECGGKPVLILNDMTDQHFKGGQRLPKVGVMDRNNVLRRKLQVAFPNYPIRGALPMKGKVKLAAKDRSSTDVGVKAGGGMYLFAAVPISEPVVKTLEAVKLSMVSIAGFALLPVESSDMVKAIADKLAGKSKSASRWVVFIGQHQSGALRQVITRDGQLAMTRMTPVVDSDADPQAWAQDVWQEFKATLSYLSRFGYSAEEGTDVVVIANPEAGNALEKLIDTPVNFSSLTAPEAARLLGMRIGIQEDGRYAEPLHVAWAGRKTKFILPMEAADIQRIHQPRQIAAAAMILMILGGGYLGWQLSSEAQAMISTRSDLEAQRSVLVQAESEYRQEVARMEALGFDVDLIQGTLKAYSEFEQERIEMIPLIQKIGEGLGNELRLDSLSIDKIAPELAEPGSRLSRRDDDPSKPKVASLEARLSLSFPPTIELEYGISEITKLRSRLAALMPEYDVVVSRQIARPEYDINIKGVAGRTAEEIAAEEDYRAELVIRGPKK